MLYVYFMVCYRSNSIYQEGGDNKAGESSNHDWQKKGVVLSQRRHLLRQLLTFHRIHADTFDDLLCDSLQLISCTPHIIFNILSKLMFCCHAHPDKYFLYNRFE